VFNLSYVPKGIPMPKHVLMKGFRKCGGIHYQTIALAEDCSASWPCHFYNWIAPCDTVYNKERMGATDVLDIVM